jgi:hypothetical protein
MLPLSLLAIASLFPSQIQDSPWERPRKPTPAGGSAQILHSHYMDDWPNWEAWYGHTCQNVGDLDGDGIKDYLLTDSSWLNDPVSIFSGQAGDLIYSIDIYPQINAFWSSPGAIGIDDVDGDGIPDLAIREYAWSHPQTVLCSGATGVEIRRFNDHGALANAGDVDRDGVGDILLGFMGAPKVISGLTGATLLEWSDHGNFQNLGFSVANCGDLNGDSFDDFLLGAASTLGGSGDVVACSGMDGTTLFEFDVDGKMGGLVNFLGDFNGDGTPDILFGSSEVIVNGQIQCGAIEVYSGLDGQPIARYTGIYPHDQFGFSAIGAGDVNGDGYDDLLIGAIGDNSNGLYPTGKTILYSGATQKPMWVFEGEQAWGHQGFSMAAMGDTTGDGYDNFLTTAVGWDGAWYWSESTIRMFAFDPFVLSSGYSISASAGGSIDLEINFPTSAAGYSYKTLISESGNGPTMADVPVPVTMDSMVISSWMNHYPFPGHSGMHGVLNSSGESQAQLNIPPGLPSAMIGKIFWLAVVAHPLGAGLEFSSIDIPIQITP